MAIDDPVRFGNLGQNDSGKNSCLSIVAGGMTAFFYWQFPCLDYLIVGDAGRESQFKGYLIRKH